MSRESPLHRLAEKQNAPRQDIIAPYSDDVLALRFVERHGAEFRYVSSWAKWFRWDGTRWAEERTLEVFDLVRGECRRAANEPGCSRKEARDILGAKTVAAVERLARADRRVAATTDQWDGNDWLLNTPNYVIGLTSGERLAHRADDYMTKITAVSPGDNGCPAFTAFLDRITGNDAGLIAYIKRLAGYSLTGSTREHVIAYGHGNGANGKSVLLNTLAGIIGGYAANAPIETFTASGFDRHPTELARLDGARLVTASETEEGRAWAESRIKSLTGGDRITARFMRADFFEFTPKFKLFVIGNHKPTLRSVDEAIRRRLHLIPFSVTIPMAERDPDLFEKLREEWPGILQWAIDGCLEWQAAGLKPPAIVNDATADYLAGEDAVALWLAERCRRTQMGFAGSSELFKSWTAWATAAGENVGSQKRLSQAIEAKGFIKSRDSSGDRAGFRGLTVIPDEQPKWHDR